MVYLGKLSHLELTVTFAGSGFLQVSKSMNFTRLCLGCVNILHIALAASFTHIPMLSCSKIKGRSISYGRDS